MRFVQVTLSGLRSWMIGVTLRLMGFRRISGHWVYCTTLDRDSVVLDFGANKGDFSGSIVKRYKSQCYAIEPNEAMIQFINKRNIKVIQAAIGTINGYFDFYINSNPEASSFYKDFQNLWPTSEKEKVRCVTLSTLLQQLSLVDKKIELIKLDIEGAEVEVINRIDKNQVKWINQITVEFHHHLNVKLMDSSNKAKTHLLQLGFTPFANRISPTEVCFLNSNKLRFSFGKRITFWCYRRIRFKVFENY